MYLLGLHIVAALLLAGGLWLVLRTGWEWKVGGIVLTVCGLAIPVGVWYFHDQEETRVTQTRAEPATTRVAHRPGATPPTAGGRAWAQTFPAPAHPTRVAPPSASPATFTASTPPLPPPPKPCQVTGTRPAWTVVVRNQGSDTWQRSGILARQGRVYVHSGPEDAAGLQIGIRTGSTTYGPWDIGTELAHPLGAHFLFDGSGELVYRLRHGSVVTFHVIEPDAPATELGERIDMKQWRVGEEAIDRS